MDLRASLLVVISLGSACATLDEPAPPATGAVEQHFGGGGCDEFMCGTNSPQVKELGFTDLNVPTLVGTAGAPNNVGLQILGFFTEGGGYYLPAVSRGRLIARPTTTTPPNNVALTGAALIHGYFLLEIVGPKTRLFKIRVEEVNHVTSWAQPPSVSVPAPMPGLPQLLVTLETYKLNYGEIINGLAGDLENVCNHPGGRDDMGMTGPLSYHVLLFEGDRIDPNGKTDLGVEANWFTLGCAGSALAKLALTGHTEAAKHAGTFVTTIDERTTMLKMLTGDYCGHGTPFTVSGQPLQWADDHGTMAMRALLTTPPHVVVREARWTPTGAACLDAPRVDEHWTPLGQTTFLDDGTSVYSKVKALCPLLPPCTGSDLSTAGYHLVTGTQPLPPPP